MITVCFNPVCKRELLYLREGRVVRLVKTQGGQARVEHFWLCGDCYQLYDFQFSAKGVSGCSRELSHKMRLAFGNKRSCCPQKYARKKLLQHSRFSADRFSSVTPHPDPIPHL
jgi:hypothetical protein